MSLSIKKLKFECLECGNKSKYLFQCLCQCCKNCFKINIYKSIKNPDLKKNCFICKKKFLKNSVTELKNFDFNKKILIFTKLKISNICDFEKKKLMENIKKVNEEFNEAIDLNKKNNSILKEKEIFLDQVLENILIKKKFLIEEIPTNLLLKDKFGILKKIFDSKYFVVNSIDSESFEESKEIKKNKQKNYFEDININFERKNFKEKEKNNISKDKDDLKINSKNRKSKSRLKYKKMNISLIKKNKSLEFVELIKKKENDNYNKEESFDVKENFEHIFNKKKELNNSTNSKKENIQNNKKNHFFKNKNNLIFKNNKNSNSNKKKLNKKDQTFFTNRKLNFENVKKNEKKEFFTNQKYNFIDLKKKEKKGFFFEQNESKRETPFHNRVERYGKKKLQDLENSEIFESNVLSGQIFDNNFKNSDFKN